MTQNYLVIYYSDFKLDYLSFETKKAAFNFIEKSINNDRYQTRENFIVVTGELLPFDIEETRSIKVLESD